MFVTLPMHAQVILSPSSTERQVTQTLDRQPVHEPLRVFLAPFAVGVSLHVR